eukprot:2210254-Prymnesium_polylepis.1
MLTLRGPGHARSCALRSRPFNARGRSRETRDLADPERLHFANPPPLWVDLVASSRSVRRGPAH